MSERPGGQSRASQTVARDRFIVVLVERVMGWTVGPDRYLMADRKWKPLWRFRPSENLADAFELLDRAAPEQYSICGCYQGECRVRVQINGRIGDASGVSRPLAIAQAVAR